MAKRMTVCYPNNAIMACKPKYDSRQTAVTIIAMLNSGFIKVPEEAGRVHFQARGFLYSAIKTVQSTWVSVPETPVKAVE
jgi:hypothetical protein